MEDQWDVKFNSVDECTFGSASKPCVRAGRLRPQPEVDGCAAQLRLFLQIKDASALKRTDSVVAPLVWRLSASCRVYVGRRCKCVEAPRWTKSSKEISKSWKITKHTQMTEGYQADMTKTLTAQDHRIEETTSNIKQEITVQIHAKTSDSI